MHFDPDRAHRLRAVLAATGQAPAEKKMFGWLSLLVRGNTCCGAASTSSAQADLATLPFDMRQGHVLVVAAQPRCPSGPASKRLGSTPTTTAQNLAGVVLTMQRRASRAARRRRSAIRSTTTQPRRAANSRIRPYAAGLEQVQSETA